jgi:2-polyprenyl-3-methyl-5-hydroxy-6-metoxy-1,4-benzoquinol methylase
MSDYLNYLQSISSPKTFARKIGYIKYNFGRYFNFKNPSEATVLEIGAGLGQTVQYLNDKGCVHIDIVDNDESVLNYIRKTYKIDQTFKSDDLGGIDSSLKEYDAIIATQVLEHVPLNQYKTFMTTLFKHLKKDGHIIITVPNMANPFTLYERYGDITHTSAFTDNSLKELVAMCDINGSVVEVIGFHIPPYTPLNLIRIVFQKLLHLMLLAMSIMNAGGYSKLLTPNITLIIKK